MQGPADWPAHPRVLAKRTCKDAQKGGIPEVTGSRDYPVPEEPRGRGRRAFFTHTPHGDGLDVTWPTSWRNHCVTPLAAGCPLMGPWLLVGGAAGR